MGQDSEAPTILVVDDDRAVRTLVQAYLERAGYAVLTAGDGEEGLDVFRRHQDGIALLLTDVVMPKMDGMKLADAVLKVRPHLPVIFISGNAQNADRGHGCLAKPFTSSQLVNKIHQVLASKKWSGQSSTENGRGKQPAEPLSPREKEVLQLICQGCSSKAIARQLGISFKTVTSHRTHILEKVGVRKTVSLVRFAIRAGYIEA